MSLTERVYKVSELKLDNFVFGEPKQNQKTRLVQVSLTYNDPELGPVKPFIQTPIVNAPFGIQIDEFDGKKKTSITISYKGYQDDSNPKMTAFYNFMDGLNQKVFDYAHKNSMALFKKKCSKEILENNYTHMIRWSKDKETRERSTKYAPNTRLNFRTQFESDEYEVGVLDESKKQINSSEIESTLSRKGMMMICVIELNSMWISGGKAFGLSLSAKTIRLAKQNRLPKFAVRSDSDNESDDEDEVTNSDVTREATVFENNLDDDDDEEEEESDSDEGEINDAMSKTSVTKK